MLRQILRLALAPALCAAAGPASAQETGDAPSLQDQIRELVEARFEAFAVETGVETGAGAGSLGDFAGGYRIEMTGCGTQCQAIGVYKTGDDSPLAGLTASHGALFRPDSRLLIINDPVDLIAWEELPAYLTPRCYVFEDEVFAEVVCGFGFQEG